MDNQVAPGELEELLLHEFKAIDEVAVVGIPHPNYGEAPAAVITLKVTQKGQEIVTEEEIRRFISSEYILAACVFDRKRRKKYLPASVPRCAWPLYVMITLCLVFSSQKTVQPTSTSTVASSS